MKIETLENILQTNYEHGTTLQVPLNNLLQSQAISQLIADYLMPQLEIINFSKQPPTLTQLIYTGQMNLLNQLFGVTAIFYLTNSVTDGTPQLTLAVSLPAGWTFGVTFQAFKGQIVDSLTFTKPLFVLESYTNDGSNTYPGIAQGFNFSGTLQVTASPVLDPVNWLLGSNLLLTGVLTSVADPANTAPVMTSATPLDSSSLQVGAVTLYTQTQVVSKYTLPPAELDSTPNQRAVPVLTTSVSLLGSLQLGNTPDLALTLSVELSPDPIILFLAITSASDLKGLSDLTGYAGGSALSNLIPAQFPLSQYFSLNRFALTISPAFEKVLNLTMDISLRNSSGGEDGPIWTIIPNVVSLVEIGTSFFIINPTSPAVNNIFASIYATLYIANTFPLVVSIALPDVTIQAFLPPGATIPVDAVLQQFIGAGVKLPETTMTIYDFSLIVNPNDKTFSLAAAIKEDWHLVKFSDTVDLVLTSILLSINLAQTGFTGQFIGNLQFIGIDFMVSAQKNDASSSAWIFEGQITAPFSVPQVIEALTGWTPPAFLDNMEITALGTSYNTGDGTFKLNAAMQWPFQIASYNFELDLAFSISSKRSIPDGQVFYQGMIAGAFEFLGLKPIFIYAFDQQNHATTYTLRLDPFTVQYVDTPTDQRLLIQFGSTTVGEILAWIIKLADPGASAQLSSPWDALNSISLSNLSITLNFTRSSLEIDYPVSVDMGFIQINNFSIVYTRNYGQGQVQIQLGGKFLDQVYDKNKNPLSWDALNGQPPAVPGAGAKLLDLKYVGLGQHIDLVDISKLDTMAKVVDALQKTVVPLDDKAQNPLQQVGGLQFNSGSNWLIGANFVILDTFSLSVIFNDPQMYGLLIRVSGPSAAVFQGLSFEVLYRKISEKLGLFHVELTLPDIMRHLEFGQVSITLPIIDVDIYTDGSFRIDFGFPVSLQDFSRSFSLQVFPFVGYGGFYFAVLNSATSTSVPAVINGNFKPVIEFGFALAIGVGKTLTIGPLSAGISVSILGMLQGVLGWFNPTDTSTPKATYYKLQGFIGIVGKIYGTVDFVVVKANLSLTVYASVTLAIECYKPIIISMTAGVIVEVNITILFITVHFSFSATISLTFTVGSASTPPWIDGTNAQLPYQLRAQINPYSVGPTHMALADAAAWRGLRYRLPTTFNMVGCSINDPNDDPIVVYAAPAFSQVLPSDLNIPNFNAATSENDEGKPVVTATMLLFVENAISPQAITAKEARIPTARAADAPFNLLMIKLLRWAIQALRSEADTISALELASIHAKLDDPTITAVVFSYSNLTKFFVDSNVNFQLLPRPITQQQALSGTFFPMFPELTMGDGIITPVPFWDIHSVTPAYLQNLNIYFKQLLVEYENSVERDPQETGNDVDKTFLTGEGDPTSIAAFIFCSYFELLTKSVVQNAQDYLQAYTYTVDPAQAPDLSLQDIAASFEPGTAEYIVRQGDTFASIAAYVGLPEHLISAQASEQGVNVLQPGSRLSVSLPVTAERIVTANQSRTGILTSGGTPPFSLTLAGVVYQVKDGDTLSLIASTLSTNTLDLLTANADLEALVVIGTSIDFGTLNYTGKLGDSQASVAQYFGVDLSQVDQKGDQYTISGVAHVVGRGIIIPYTVKEGDTLDSIIEYYFTPPPLTPDQLANLEAVIKNWNPQITDFTNLVPGTLIQIPYNETFHDLARYYYLSQDKATQLATLLPLVETLKLMPLVTLAVPTITYPVRSTDTLAAIAQKFNLTLDALTSNIATTKGILLPGIEIKVPDVPAIKIEDLCNGLKQSPLLNTAAGMASRFLLQGLRLPYPQDADDMNRPWTPQTALKTYPMYALTGQEYQLPAPIPQDYAITLTLTRPAPWLQMPAGDSLPELPILLQPDEISQVDEFGQLQFESQVKLLTRLPLYTYGLRRFALQNLKHWQAAALPAATCLISTNQYAGEPTIWPLPASLQAQIAHAEGYELLYNVAVSTYIDSNSGIQVSDVQCYLWATCVDLLVQEIPAADYSAATLPNSYLMVGADDQGKQTLLNVLQYLTDQGRDDQATLFLLYQPDPSGSNPKGLASDALDAAATYLLQTNLSTVGHSGNLQENLPLAARATMVSPNSATIDNALAFLTLLWEGSVVKSGGYYLHYTNSNGESGLPGYLFAQNKSATLTLLIALARQEHIQPFNNTVVIGDNIDASKASVFVEPLCYVVEPGDTFEDIQTKCKIAGMTVATLAKANATILGLLRPTATLQIQDIPYTIKYGDTLASLASSFGVTVEALAAQNSSNDIFTAGAIMQYAAGQLQMQASVPPGNSGFQLQRSNPNDEQNASDNQKALNNLFSLLGFNIAPNTNFTASWEGLPPGPSHSSQEGSDGIRAASSALQEDKSTWDYKQVVSIYQSAESQFNEATDSPALPARANFPYAGINTTPGAPQSTVLLDLNFQDPYGNRTVPDAPLSLPAIPVGYTDDLIGYSQWPGVSGGFDFPNSTPTLVVEATFMVAKYLPDSSNPYESAHNNARTDYEHYLSIYYQLQQRDLRQFTLQTSFGNVELEQQTQQLIQLAMRGLVSENYQFLNIAKGLAPSTPPIASGQTLAGVATSYAVQVSDLITANKDVVLFDQWFAPQTALDIPTYYIFKADDTPASIAAQITLEQIEANADVALKAGTIINLRPDAPQTVTVDGSRHPTILSIAQAHYTTVANVAQTSEDIALSTPLILTLEGYSVVVTPECNTLALAAREFNRQNGNLQATSAYVGVANQNLADIFPDKTILKYTQYVIQEGDSLRTIAQAFQISVRTLLENNLNTPDLFEAGTALYLGDAASIRYVLTETDTFADVAQAFNISLAEVSRLNGGTPLLAVNQTPETTYLMIPFLLEFPQDTTIRYTSYRANGTETLESIVALYPSWSLEGLLDLNNDVMGIFATSPLPIGDHYTPQLTDTINTLAVHFNMTPLEFADSVKSLSDVLRHEALILCPPLLTGDNSTAMSVAQSYHFTSAELVAQANAAIHGLLLAGQEVYYTDPATSKEVRYMTGVHDTFVTIVANLNRLLSSSTVTIGSMLVQNPQLTFVAGFPLLPPPRTASFSANVTMPASYPQAIFPLTVMLSLSRNQNLVDPDFSDQINVYTTSTALVALPLLNDPNATASLTRFARNFEQAFQGLKLGSGSQPENAAEEGTGSSLQRLWIVNFNAERGGLKYQVQPEQVRFFAIKPLSTQLWNASNITFKTYTSGQGLSGTTTQDIQNADLDLWLSSLLEAVDTFLSPSYVVPAYQANQAIYQDVMDRKSDLASKIRGLVDDLLLTAPSQTENLVQDPLESARDALYQQALISLADAYTSTVLMQYPFTIQAPQCDVALAPQLSGKPMAKVYTTGARDDLNSLVSYYGVSRISLVAFLQGRQNILNPNAIVAIAQGGVTYQITSTDTFNTLALFFEVDLDTLAEHIFVTNDQGLFLPGVVINATNATRQFSTGDTFARVADYLGVAVTDLVWVNKDVANVFQAGTEVKLVNEQGQSVAIPVEQGDTLSTITSKLYNTPTPDQAQIEAVAIQLWTCDLTNGSNGLYGYVLNLGTKVYAIQEMPVFSFTTGTVSLAPGQAPATFLFTVKDAAQRKMTFLNLDYVINELQYGLQPPQFGGYQQSSWLSFIIPLDESNAARLHSSAVLGQAQIPIPLRIYPTSASLSSQTANPSHKDSPDLKLAKEWTYAFGMDHQNAAQDSLEMGVYFNWTSSTPVPQRSSLSNGSETALYTALVQFATAYPQLKMDLNLLITDPANEKIARALSAFSQLLLDVCSTWPTGSGDVLPQPISGESHWYELDTIVDQETADRYKYLMLKTIDQPAIWPQISDKGPDIIIPGTPPNPSEALYDYTQPITQPLDLLCSFVEQDVIQRQNGWSSISVTRNQQLLTLSAANQPVETNPAFVYSTPLSLFANKIYPLLSISNLSPFQNVPRTTTDPVTELAIALGDFFSALFNLNENPPPTTYNIKVATRYIYTKVALPAKNAGFREAGIVIDAPEALNSILPVVLVSQYNFNAPGDADPGDQNSFVSQLAMAIDTAATRLGVTVPSGARTYLFDVTVYSSLSTSGYAPLLQITNLLYQPQLTKRGIFQG